ncbi:MAG: nitrilase-related carbon-nitrogen hydrolase [Gammaproteobacteria bacterium]
MATLANRHAARTQMAANITRISAALEASAPYLADGYGLPVRLVVLPEYVLTGAPTDGPFVLWRDLACLDIAGAEYEALAGIASRGGFFLAGNAYEADPHFPELYFQCSFVINPAGTVVLRYRRLVSLYSPSPYDVWDRYLSIYGIDGVYPVADTEIGRIAAVASEEILYPEIARCHVMRGAEILVHSTSEMGSPRSTAKELARQARAAENLAYVVSANTAGVPGGSLPSRSSTGMSKIIDFNGRIIADAPPGGASIAAHGTIDIAALRSRRRQSGLANTVSRLPLQAFAASYARNSGRTRDALAGTPNGSRSHLQAIQASTIDRLSGDGTL